MLPTFTDIEARIIGCLMEKSLVTPDQYPLTPNALTNACNQKSSRDPVMSLDQGKVQHVARELKDKHLLHIEENFKSGVEKYKQRFCNSTFSTYKFDHAQFAIICLLLLRGPQTLGELKTHSHRLFEFDDLDDVQFALKQLIEHEPALVTALPRQAGQKEGRYAHLLSGEPDIPAPPISTTSTGPTTGLAARVEELEAELADIRDRLTAIEDAARH